MTQGGVDLDQFCSQEPRTSVCLFMSAALGRQEYLRALPLEVVLMFSALILPVHLGLGKWTGTFLTHVLM